MSTEILKYEEEHIAAGKDFNARMRQAGMPAEFELPGRPESVWLSKTTGEMPFNECYVVLSDSVVRNLRLKNMTSSHFEAQFGVWRHSRLARAAVRVAEKSGLAAVTVRAAQRIRTLRYPAEKANFEVVDEFGDWANQVWTRSELEYAMLPVRTTETLRVLYPAANRNFLRLRVTRNMNTIGWAVVGHLHFRGDENFGDLTWAALWMIWQSPRMHQQ
jgi:hypothetical protein